MKGLGILLAIVGILALVLGVFGYSQENAILAMGGLTASVTEHKTIPLAAVLGAVALIGGLVLLVAARRRAS